MKVKTDFTTNSSSSSFVCWGVSEDNLEGTDNLKLVAFENHLAEYRETSAKNPTFDWAKDAITEMESLETDEEKIEYVDESGIDEEMPAPLSKGGPSEDYGGSKFVGICPNTLEKEFPDVTFGGLRKFVAEKMNEILGTKLTASDISYYEEGWMDN